MVGTFFHQSVSRSYTCAAARSVASSNMGASPGMAFSWTGGTPAEPCANDGTLPFGAGLPVLATATLKSASTTLAGSTTDAYPGVAGSVHREWSLVPQG